MSAAQLDVSIDLLGMTVRVEVGDRPAADHVRELIGGLPESRAPWERTLRLVRQGGAVPGRKLYDGDELVQQHMSGPRAVSVLLWYLNQLALQTHDYAVLHAGAVAHDGRAVVMPAAMDAGKSTLVTALVRDGFDYFSDEFAPLGLDDGLLRPYSSPIGLDPGSFPLFPELRPRRRAEFDDPTHWYVPVAPAANLPDAIAPTAIVFPAYAEGSPCSVTPLPTTIALARASNETLNFFDLGRRAFHALSSLAKQARAYQLVFGDLGEACGAIRLLLAEEAT